MLKKLLLFPLLTIITVALILKYVIFELSFIRRNWASLIAVLSMLGLLRVIPTALGVKLACFIVKNERRIPYRLRIPVIFLLVTAEICNDKIADAAWVTLSKGVEDNSLRFRTAFDLFLLLDAVSKTKNKNDLSYALMSIQLLGYAQKSKQTKIKNKNTIFEVMKDHGYFFQSNTNSDQIPG